VLVAVPLRAEAARASSCSGPRSTVGESADLFRIDGQALRIYARKAAYRAQGPGVRFARRP
jgi:hypothetical protein